MAKILIVDDTEMMRDSLATTLAPCWAATIEVLPVPAATSRTLVPEVISAALTSSGPSGSRKVSTIEG